MVRKAKLQNVGVEKIPADEELGGFAPGVQEQITADAGEGNSESDAQETEASVEVDAETEADMDAAGVNVDPKSDRAKRSALMSEVAKVGKNYGAGKVSMIALAEMVTEAAASGLLTFNDQRKKGAPKKSDAQEVYDRFRSNADTKATLDGGLVPDSVLTGKGGDEAKAGKQQVAKLNAFIKFGNVFRDDASDLVTRARNIHIALLGDEEERKLLKPGSTYSMLVAIAAKHVDKDELKANPNHLVWEDDRLKGFMQVEGKETAEPDAAKKLMDAIASAMAARDGSIKTGREPAVETDLINDAIELVRHAVASENDGAKRLGEFDAKHAKAASSGSADALAKAAGNAQPVDGTAVPGVGATVLTDDEGEVETE
jgi:hypothetical protein